MLLLYFLIQHIEGKFVTPIIIEKQIYLLRVYTLALLTAFGFLLFFLGVFLALPILIVIQTRVKEVLSKNLLGRWQTDPAEKRYYSP